MSSNINKTSRHYVPFIIFFAISLIIEVLIFNYDFFASLSNNPISVAYSLNSSFSQNADGSYTILSDNAFFEITDIDTVVKNIYIDAEMYKKSDNDNLQPVNISLSAQDEGNALYYKLGDTSSYSSVEKSKYTNIYTYGKLNSLKLSFTNSKDCIINLNSIILNANVPFHFSFLRALMFFGIFSLIWTFRPSSPLYRQKLDNSKRQKACLTIAIMSNVLLCTLLIGTNSAFINPPWQHHNQYAMLAESLSQGRVDLNLAPNSMLDNMENPYDTALRYQEAPDAPWDIAYFNQKYYVYFGIVPELIFYFPFYLITQAAFPTWIGIYLTCVLIIISAFILIRKIIEFRFPETSLGAYLLLSIIVANGTGTIPALLCPGFYSLPILMAIFFTFAGLSLWISAAMLWKKDSGSNKYSAEYKEEADQRQHSSDPKKLTLHLFLGSLCMALVAGCRPQFLVGSFFAIPLFGHIIFGQRSDITDTSNSNTFHKAHPLAKLNSLSLMSAHFKPLLIRFAVFTLPYIVVAGGLMYYNYIRFGSVFDFGANYNLTTNDMPHRGFNLGRIPDGIFMYLFQLPNITLEFPFVQSTSFTSGYIGKTIKEAMHGGIFFTHTFLLINLFFFKLRKELKQKKLFSTVMLCLSFTLLIVVLSTEMSGILPRYHSDYSWLIFLSAAIIFLQLCEKHKNTPIFRYIILFTVICGFAQILLDLLIGFDISGIKRYDPETFFRIKHWFTI